MENAQTPLALAISQLVEYAVRKEWIQESDRVWASNRILELLRTDEFDGLVPLEGEPLPPIQEILNPLCDAAWKSGVLAGNSTSYYDLFDTALVGALLPRPSEIAAWFRATYDTESPERATDWYYAFSGDTNYIRRDRIARDVHWKTNTVYGALDITINLSKPEKDPVAIAEAGRRKSSGYPKCLLCAEN